MEAGGHINPAVTFGLCIARKVTIVRALTYIIAQCLGAMCGAALAKGVQGHYYEEFGGGVNLVQPGYSTGSALGAEILGTFILVYTVFSATDPQRSARDSHVPVRDIHMLNIPRRKFISVWNLMFLWMIIVSVCETYMLKVPLGKFISMEALYR